MINKNNSHNTFFKKNIKVSSYTKTMKKTKLLNITFLSTTLLFFGCSNSQKNIKKKSLPNNVSLYNIMGITESNKPFSFNKKEHSTITISPNITYISYKKASPPNLLVEQNLETINKKEHSTINISPDITYISYKKASPPNLLVEQNLETINTIESTAKSFLGVPYVWGATGPSKFDCSGFTQWVYRDVGINIPRVSKNQARVGEFVSYEELQRGDMVFFDTKKKPTGGVTHVGIYLGDNEFIHASSTGKSVVIYNFNEKNFYKKRFLWGRRVIKPDFHYALN